MEVVYPSESQVKYFIHQSNLIENIDDPKEDKQSYAAWVILSGITTQLTHGLICSTQKLITLNNPLLPNQKGYYRDISKTQVQIAGEVAPSPQIVPFLMDNWLLDYGDWQKEFDPTEAHVRFEKIHPFVDGNGRTGRMLLNWQRIRKGMPLLIIPNKTKYEAYYPWFKR